MLVQTHSTIYKSDLSVWKRSGRSLVNEIFSSESSSLKRFSEMVLEENASTTYQTSAKSKVLIIVLYGEIALHDFDLTLTAHETFYLSTEQVQKISMTNLLDESSDCIIAEFNDESNLPQFGTEPLIFKDKNRLQIINKSIKNPNFIGLFEGRKEEFYALQNEENSVFAMVINGAFEFQNRLMETRDAAYIHQPKEIEFEALSEDALIIMFEV